MSEMSQVLEAMSSAWNEAKLLKAMMLSLEDQISDITNKITNNKKDIERIQLLIKQTADLEKQRDEMKVKLAASQGELNTRLAKLEKAGIKLPLNDIEKVKGMVFM